MTPDEIESIERATLAAVPPDATEELPGRPAWLLGLDPGSVGRAHSAVPLQHTPVEPALQPAVLSAIEARYAAHGLRAVFRIPAVPAFDGLRAALAHGGYAVHQPTLVQVGTVSGLLTLPVGAQPVPVDLSATPDAAWAAIFLGEGFDAADGAHRVRLLGRSQQSVFASISVGGAPVACGTASFSHGWASVHGMRTAPDQRGRGLASHILRALAGQARSRGVENVFLQVDADNAHAQALYRRAGFETAWGYAYWRKAAR